MDDSYFKDLPSPTWDGPDTSDAGYAAAITTLVTFVEKAGILPASKIPTRKRIETDSDSIRNGTNVDGEATRLRILYNHYRFEAWKKAQLTAKGQTYVYSNAAATVGKLTKADMQKLYTGLVMKVDGVVLDAKDAIDAINTGLPTKDRASKLRREVWRWRSDPVNFDYDTKGPKNQDDATSSSSTTTVSGDSPDASVEEPSSPPTPTPRAGDDGRAESARLEQERQSRLAKEAEDLRVRRAAQAETLRKEQERARLDEESRQRAAEEAAQQEAERKAQLARTLKEAREAQEREAERERKEAVERDRLRDADLKARNNVDELKARIDELTREKEVAVQKYLDAERDRLSVVDRMLAAEKISMAYVDTHWVDPNLAIAVYGNIAFTYLRDNKIYAIMQRNQLQPLLDELKTLRTAKASGTLRTDAPLLVGTRSPLPHDDAVRRDVYQALGQGQLGTRRATLHFTDADGAVVSRMTATRLETRLHQGSGRRAIVVEPDSHNDMVYEKALPNLSAGIPSRGTVHVTLNGVGEPERLLAMEYSTGDARHPGVTSDKSISLYATSVGGGNAQLDMLVIHV